jgi:hypothetical protein
MTALKSHRTRAAVAAALAFSAGLWAAVKLNAGEDSTDTAAANASRMLADGRTTFRFDTFGDEAFWGDTLKLHRGIERVSPKAALAAGLKVDVNALPDNVRAGIRNGQINLNDPAVTVALLKLSAIVGVTGFFDQSGALKSIGIQCAICHSTVDDGFAPGIGSRLDGWANRDLNVGAIVALSPDLSAIAQLLGVDEPTVRKVLAGWGPGKFDAELLMDGKGFRADGRSAATLIPPAFGLAGVNLHTWTGWGSVTHWNAFVANLEMHGKGTFFDPRLNDPVQFPVAAKAGFGNVRNEPDLITSKLAALHFYQLALPAPKSPQAPSEDAARGKLLFTGKAKCAVCHVPPLYTEPGWNMHKPEEVCVDDFQASRAPDQRYRTSPLAGLFSHQKSGFYHDGRFATLGAVVEHYDSCMSLGLSAGEKSDLIAYLLSL